MTNLKRYSVLVFTFALMLGFSISTVHAQVQGQTQQGENYKLVGQVVDANTGEALSNVEVKVESANQQTGQTQTETQIESETGMGIEEGEKTETTNDQGQFTFSELSSGEHTITIEHDGYKTWERRVNLNQDSQLTIELQPTQ